MDIAWLSRAVIRHRPTPGNPGPEVRRSAGSASGASACEAGVRTGSTAGPGAGSEGASAFAAGSEFKSSSRFASPLFDDVAAANSDRMTHTTSPPAATIARQTAATAPVVQRRTDWWRLIDLP